MSAPIDVSLQRAIERLSSPDILTECRRIQLGDELCLMPAEARSIASPLMRVRRASGTARALARELLERLGHAPCAIPKGDTGAPQWPAGFVGSFAHDGDIAVAVVATRRAFDTVGIDIEPAEPLPEDLCDLVLTPFERMRLGDNPLPGPAAVRRQGGGLQGDRRARGAAARLSGHRCRSGRQASTLARRARARPALDRFHLCGGAGADAGNVRALPGEAGTGSPFGNATRCLAPLGAVSDRRNSEPAAPPSP